MNNNWNVSVQLTHTAQHNNTKSHFLSLTVLHPYVPSVCFCFIISKSVWPVAVTYFVRSLFILIWYNLIHYNPLYVSGSMREWEREWVILQFETIQNSANATKLYSSPRNGSRNKNHSTQDFTQQCVLCRLINMYGAATWTSCWQICTVCVYNTINACLFLLLCNCWDMLSLHTKYVFCGFNYTCTQ